MRDAVELEKRGIPSVIITEGIFQAAAQSLARTLGLPDLPLVVVPQPKGGMTHQDKVDLVKRITPQIFKGLTTVSG